MKQFIKTKLIEFLNERYEINNLPKDIILLSNKLSDEEDIFLLYHIINKKPIGVINFGFYEKIKSFTVGGAYSENGYGAFLYECAMTYIYPNWLSMSRDSITSDDALSVWGRFLERSDVENERINSDEITHKKEDWLDSGFLDDQPEYRQSIFDLEDTRFRYNFGKDKLNNLLKNGKEYMSKNNISENDVEYMSWDLEK